MKSAVDGLFYVAATSANGLPQAKNIIYCAARMIGAKPNFAQNSLLVSNEDLLVAVASGNKNAFRELYDATSSRLYPICLKMLRDRDAANDVFQEAYFRIWQKANLYNRDKGPALGWMVTITRRCVLDRLAQTKRTSISLDDADEELLSSASERLGGGSVEALSLKRCLENLDAKYSRAILLAYFHGLTHEELSSKLSVPLGTAKSWVTRGLAKLQDCLAS
ncbi:sigma-70 family RNA polymerase sigma factor [Hyphomicrobium sp.]|uniref:RNA polymerase sigma factor n=1 Tax=Hyphomicrobium sp. TaxID=82 RepID=UPI000FAF7B14|nr:sigma-70 family RNA polymerase sigma factor [Hyphomicrobium sp.]RUP00364.1 MAG: sigma-70 family RNA polymerase sigma factor [Hyphomicrobium sp.]